MPNKLRLAKFSESVPEFNANSNNIIAHCQPELNQAIPNHYSLTFGNVAEISLAELNDGLELDSDCN